jgi:acyl carrier protein
MTATAGAVADRLRLILAEVTGRPEFAGLPDETALFGSGAGLDSLAGTLLLRRIEREFGVDVAAEDMNLDALETLGTLASFVAERSAGPRGVRGVVPPGQHRT